MVLQSSIPALTLHSLLWLAKMQGSPEENRGFSSVQNPWNPWKRKQKRTKSKENRKTKKERKTEKQGLEGQGGIKKATVTITVL